MMMSYLHGEDFFEDQDESFLYRGNPSAATPMTEVCGAKGDYFKK